MLIHCLGLGWMGRLLGGDDDDVAGTWHGRAAKPASRQPDEMQPQHCMGMGELRWAAGWSISGDLQPLGLFFLSFGLCL